MGSSDAAVATTEEPAAEGESATSQLEPAPSLEPSESAAEESGVPYAVPAEDPDNEAARIVMSLDDDESAVTIGPQQLGPDFTVSAQCRGTEAVTLELRDATVDPEEVATTQPVFTLEVPCGDVVSQDNSLENAPNSVQPMFVSDVEGYEAWATVTNGVG